MCQSWGKERVLDVAVDTVVAWGRHSHGGRNFMENPSINWMITGGTPMT